MAPHDDSAQVQTSGHRGILLPLVAALAVSSSLIGRALAPALPGSLAGISSFIKLLNGLSSFLSQLFAFGGLLVGLTLVSRAVRVGQRDLVFKLTALPVTIVVGFLIMTRMRLDYSEPRSSLALALASCCLALAAAPRLIQVPSTRAQGLALALGGTAGVLHAAGRGLALQANLQAMPGRFTLARAIETAAISLDVVLLALVAAWLFGMSRSGIFKLLALTAFVAFLSHAALRGSGPNAWLWEVLASRSIGHLLRAPAPFLPYFMRSVVVLLQICLSVWLIATRRPSTTRLVFCLCLVSAGATDIPLLALSLTLAALIARAHVFDPAKAARTAPVGRKLS